MKIIFLFLVLFSSQLALARTQHLCTFNNFKISITTNKVDLISLEIFKENTKVSGCLLKVISYDDGKNGASLDELTRFEIQECNVIYDKVASKVPLIQSGFIKVPSSKGKKSFAYVIKNEQPLVCKYK